MGVPRGGGRLIQRDMFSAVKICVLDFILEIQCLLNIIDTLIL